MANKKHRDILLYSDTARSADALYFGGSRCRPLHRVQPAGQKIRRRERPRVRPGQAHLGLRQVLPLEACVEQGPPAWPRRRQGPARVIALLARERKARALHRSGGLSRRDSTGAPRLGLRIAISDGPLFPEREVKSPAEAAAIREGNRCSAAGIAAAERVLRACRVRGGRLLYRGAVLTSERLKVAIETACIEAGSVSSSTIAAGGDQACDPHNRGSGPLRANELIIVDVFPRVSQTGYHGDMTRTFLRGRASDAQKAIVAAVRAAQLAALSAIRAGVNGSVVHRAVSETFLSRGYETGTPRAGPSGFSTAPATASASRSTSRPG
jgi:Xaa-Pro aminopeptidase